MCKYRYQIFTNDFLTIALNFVKQTKFFKNKSQIQILG